MSLYQKIVSTNAPRPVILIRLIVGGVFFTKGIQKSLFSDEVGVGRFVKMGIPSPEFTAPLAISKLI
ncbi:MAG: DoxX family protein [Acidobacteriota bacterium]